MSGTQVRRTVSKTSSPLLETYQRAQSRQSAAVSDSPTHTQDLLTCHVTRSGDQFKWFLGGFFPFHAAF